MAVTTAPALAPVLALTVGLLSTLHCVGMCGGIVGAISLSLPGGAPTPNRRFIAFLLATHLGRILSYGLAGAAFGGLGAALLEIEPRVWLADVLRLSAAVVVVAMGLAIGGWWPRLASVERWGGPVWRRLEPLGRALLPVRTLPGAVLFGAIWGWLPCGLVYTMLIGAPAQGGALAGAVYMALFGLGTLPALLAVGLFAGQLRRFGQDRRFQAAAGLAVMALGLLALNAQGYNGAH